jgi:hypothetical protein
MFAQVQVDEASFDSVSLETILGEARNQPVNPMAAGRKSAQHLPHIARTTTTNQRRLQCKL